jgi:septal ring factor EnvC (AmiA/AmiB activator)
MKHTFANKFSILFSVALIQFAVQESKATDLATDILAEKAAVLKKEEERRTLLVDIYNIHRQLRRFDRERMRFDSEKKNAQESVNSLSQLISKIEKRIETQKETVNRRLRSLYKFGHTGFLRVIASSSTSSDLDRNLKFLKIVSEKDYAILQDHRMLLAAKKEQQNLLLNENKKLFVIESLLKQKKQQLANKQKAKDKLLSQIDSKKVLHLTKLQRLRLETSELKNDNSQLERLKGLESALSPSFFELRGKIAKPVQGRLLQDCGLSKLGESNFSIRSKGQLFETEVGESVVAVSKGQVKLSEFVPNSGHLLILDHGDHYYSLYNFNSEPAVKSGQSVSQGQRLATFQSQQDLSNLSVYFELRHFSEPLDPKEWFEFDSLSQDR